MSGESWFLRWRSKKNIALRDSFGVAIDLVDWLVGYAGLH